MLVSKAELGTKTAKNYLAFLIMGAQSVSGYSLLYFLSTDMVAVAHDTNTGHKELFFMPIVIAMVFSLAHGAFTSYFWNIPGVKAKS